MTVKTMYYSKRYSEKPKGSETAEIQCSLKETEIEIRDLAKGLASGATFRPAVLSGRTKDTFQRQEIFGIDFDHGTTIDDELRRCLKIGIIPVFGYCSFSHTKSEHRFRLVFRSDRMIDNLEERDKIQLALLRAFPNSDQKCRNADRLFYGGKTLIYENYDSCFSPDELIEMFPEPKEEPQKKKPVVKKDTATKPKTRQKNLAQVDETHEAKIEAIKRLDVAEMKRLLGLVDTTIDNEPQEEPITDLKFRLVTTRENADAVKSIMDKVKEQFGIGLNDVVKFDTFTKENSCQILSMVDFIYTEIEKQSVEIKFEFEFNKNDNDDNSISELQCNKKKWTDKQLLVYQSTISQNPTCDIINVFKCRQDLYDYIMYEIDLFEFLGVGSGHFRCVLPGHTDLSPSANVFLTKDNRFMYKCFGCERSRSIIGIVEELAKCSRYEAMNFIKAVYNLELIESNWTVQQQQILIDAINYLDTDEFKETFPDLDRRISRWKQKLKSILMSFIPLINEDLQIDGKPLFYASYTQLQTVTDTRSREQMSRMLTQLAALKLLNKPSDDEIPEATLQKSKTIAKEHGFRKHVSYYVVGDYGVNGLSQSEEMAKLLKANNVRAMGVSRELFIRTFGDKTEGIDVDKLFPQFQYENKRGTSKRSDKLTLEISMLIVDRIERQGYTTEKEVVETMSGDYKESTIDRQLKKCLQEVMDTYGLERVRADKTLKEKYQIDSKGFPFIIRQMEQTAQEEQTEAC